MMAKQLLDSRVKITVDGFDIYAIPNSFSSNFGELEYTTKIAMHGKQIKRYAVANLEETKGMMSFQALNHPDILRQFLVLKQDNKVGKITVTAVWEDPEGNTVLVLPRATLLGDLKVAGSNDAEIEFVFEGDPIQSKI